MIKEKQINIDAIRADFPALQTKVYGKPLVYLDSGATAQKPQVVIDAIQKYYTEQNANVHRGVHHMSQVATDLFENARKTIQKYINAESSDEVIFTKGTTDGINLIASCLGETLVPGDEIIISEMEHHSNIVPWQMMCEKRKCTLKVVPVNDKGELRMAEYEAMLSDRTKLVAITHISNTLGTINPIEEIIAKAHAVGAQVMVDGAQSVQHLKVDMKAMDCDYFVFSGHKVFGPTGIGVLYGKREALEALPPYQGGGAMISRVTFEKTTYNELPFKFEAGTPHIAGGICLGTAFEYLETLDMDAITAYEKELTFFAQNELKKIDGLRIIGDSEFKTSVVSFAVDGLHPFDIGTLLDKQGIAIRTGHHCTQPLMEKFGIPGTIRASFAFYNTMEEAEMLVKGVRRSVDLLR